MNERQMEIIISRGIASVLGVGHELLAQQVGVGGGRLDLLVARPDGARTVVELKKGRLAKNTWNRSEAMRKRCLKTGG